MLAEQNGTRAPSTAQLPSDDEGVLDGLPLLGDDEDYDPVEQDDDGEPEEAPRKRARVDDLEAEALRLLGA